MNFDYNTSTIASYAKVAVKLLQGAVFDDQKDIWDDVVRYQVELADYFEKIGLELIIDKRDGYGYLKQKELDEKGTTIGLVRRISLTYEQTLACAFLREWIDEFESNDSESRNLYITPKQFRERLELFFKEKSNEQKLIRELNKYFADTEAFGFLKLVNKNVQNPDDSLYEVKRLIKARITNDELDAFKQLLEKENA